MGRTMYFKSVNFMVCKLVFFFFLQKLLCKQMNKQEQLQMFNWKM